MSYCQVFVPVRHVRQNERQKRPIRTTKTRSVIEFFYSVYGCTAKSWNFVYIQNRKRGIYTFYVFCFFFSSFCKYLFVYFCRCKNFKKIRTSRASVSETRLSTGFITARQIKKCRTVAVLAVHFLSVICLKILTKTHNTFNEKLATMKLNEEKTQKKFTKSQTFKNSLPSALSPASVGVCFTQKLFDGGGSSCYQQST